MVVSALLPHRAERVRELLSRSETTMRLGKDIRDVEVTPLANGCDRLKVVNKGFSRELRYVSERCRTADGWHSKMVSSDDFLQHDIRWVMQPAGDGAKVSIRVIVELKSIVPRWLVDRIVGGALEATLQKMDTILAEEALAQ